MPPQAVESEEPYSGPDIGTDPNWKMEIVWPNVIVQLILNAAGLYGLYLATFSAEWKTIAWLAVCLYGVHIGAAVGAHRFFSHNSFKAVLPVRLALILLQTASGQNSVYTWARDHRQHHKYADTDADPHNATRGFFFAHMGWLMVKKHPAVIAYGKKLDYPDLRTDPLIVWQKKYYIPVFLVVSIALPVAVPVYYWNETLQNAFFVIYALRYVSSLHLTWFIASAAHTHGLKPYNKHGRPVEIPLWMSFYMAGEQYHNFHHAFPRDYRGSELGAKLNFHALLIDTLASLGLAYDLRTTSNEAIRRRILKTGDGSYSLNGNILKSLSDP